MRKRKLPIGILTSLGIMAVLAVIISVYFLIPRRPFADLTAADIEKARVRIYPVDGDTDIYEEFPLEPDAIVRLTDDLRDVVFYQKDASEFVTEEHGVTKVPQFTFLTREGDKYTITSQNGVFIVSHYAFEMDEVSPALLDIQRLYQELEAVYLAES